MFKIILLILLLSVTVKADTHVSYVTEINEQVMEDFGFVEIEHNVYHTTFKEYDKRGVFVKTSDLYIIVKSFYAHLKKERVYGTLRI